MLIDIGIAAKWNDMNLLSTLQLSEEIIQDYETNQIRRPTDLRQGKIDTINIEKFGFTRNPKEHNDKLKQINISQQQPAKAHPVHQTETRPNTNNKMGLIQGKRIKLK